MIHKQAESMPGLKALKGRVTVLFGGSVAGHRLKPFVTGHRENPGPTSSSVSACGQ